MTRTQAAVILNKKLSGVHKSKRIFKMAGSVFYLNIVICYTKLCSDLVCSLYSSWGRMPVFYVISLAKNN